MRESMSDLELSGENAEETMRQYKLSDPEGYTQVCTAPFVPRRKVLLVGLSGSYNDYYY